MNDGVIRERGLGFDVVAGGPAETSRTYCGLVRGANRDDNVQ